MPFHAHVNLYTDTDGPKKKLLPQRGWLNFWTSNQYHYPLLKLSIKRAYNGEFLFKKQT